METWGFPWQWQYQDYILYYYLYLNHFPVGFEIKHEYVNDDALTKPGWLEMTGRLE